MEVKGGVKKGELVLPFFFFSLFFVFSLILPFLLRKR